MNYLLALTKQDDLIHVVGVTPRDVYTTLCGQPVKDIRPITPVPIELVCIGCAGELGPHDHIPLVSDES
jgi:hypothetical protein